MLYFGRLNYSNESVDIALYGEYMYRPLFIKQGILLSCGKKRGGGTFRVWLISSDSLKIQVSLVFINVV